MKPYQIEQQSVLIEDRTWVKDNRKIAIKAVESCLFAIQLIEKSRYSSFPSNIKLIKRQERRIHWYRLFIERCNQV